jgi:hypothetical protein
MSSPNEASGQWLLSHRGADLVRPVGFAACERAVPARHADHAAGRNYGGA